MMMMVMMMIMIIIIIIRGGNVASTSDDPEKQGVDGRIILKLILKAQSGKKWNGLDSSFSGLGPVAGSCEH
jgi:hypothetical protein